MSETMRRELTLERLKEVLLYLPDTGDFVWRKSLGWKGGLGKVAGYQSHGYISITIDQVAYRAHRLAWLWCFGRWPATSHLDHRNGVRSDNRIANLREATNAENLQNLRGPKSHSTTGVLGVHRSKEGNFVAQITVNGKRKHLGRFPTAEAAGAAYLEAKRQLHPYQTICSEIEA
jgi:hypothetical protein